MTGSARPPGIKRIKFPFLRHEGWHDNPFGWLVDFPRGTGKNGSRSFGHPRSRRFALPLWRLQEVGKPDIFRGTGRGRFSK